jgi:hypothetical protein
MPSRRWPLRISYQPRLNAARWFLGSLIASSWAISSPFSKSPMIPSSELHVQRMDHLGRQRLLAPEAGLHEVLAHVLQDVFWVFVVALGQLRSHGVKTGHAPDFLVALFRGVLVEVVIVVIKIAKF